MLFYEENMCEICVFVFSGTLMLQLDGFPTGDGVQVKAFIHFMNQ